MRSGGLGPTPGLSRRLPKSFVRYLQVYVSRDWAFEVTEGSWRLTWLDSERITATIYR